MKKISARAETSAQVLATQDENFSLVDRAEIPHEL